MTLVEKGILGQIDHHGTTMFFAPDKEVFRKQTHYATKKLEEQEKLLPELEQALLQIETTTSSPIPKMRFYQ
jgi:DNA gyrase/topoisomerase IV subunit B